jgi:CheY-like chemotaxis protein
VIFLDLRMPGGDGTVLLADLAGRPEVAGIPVFVVTAADLSDFAPHELAHARSVLAKEQLTRRAVVELVSGLTT